MKASDITFVWPKDAHDWRVGDTVRTAGEERIVVYVGRVGDFVELRPSTWWRRAWYWLRRVCLGRR
jgi:hypothetical protein